MKLSEILSGLSPVHVTGSTEVGIRELAYDSRKVTIGTLFFALPGAKTDGNRFIKEAVEKGAAAVISELTPPPPPFSLTRRGSIDKPVCWIQVKDPPAAMSRAAAQFYKSPSERLKVVGITGTKGKTTTTYFIESILTANGDAPGVIGTINYRLRGRELEKANNTTPLSLDLQRLLERMRHHGATHAVMEVSSHALSLKRVEDVFFDAAIFTNLHSDHLDFHKTRERYFEAKARFFDLLCRADSPKRRRMAALNFDDDTYSTLKHRVVAAELLSYGFRAGADLQAEIVSTSAKATVFKLKHQGRDWVIRLKLIGEHNVYNALAAAAAGIWLGVPMQNVIGGLEALESVPGRLEPVASGQPFSVLVDYAHTENALKTVLALLKKLPHNRIISVVGCGGDRDATKRGPMGVAACEASHLAIITSDNPRSEDPLSIMAQIEQGIKTGGFQNYRMIPDRASAIAEAVGMAEADDIVLIAGKGHETYQILKDRTIHFDDREAARDAIAQLTKAWAPKPR